MARVSWALLFLLFLAAAKFSCGQVETPTPPNTAVINTRGKRTAFSCKNNDGNFTTCVATCPSKCSRKCIVACPDCRTFCFCDLFPGTVCGDPRFTGGDGNIFYFHGHKDGDFCLLSDPNLHINAHFIGKHNPALNRDFTWVQALGILFGDNHQFYIGVQKTATWSDESDRLIITFDGEPVDIPAELNARWVSNSVPALSITRTANANGVILELSGVFTIMANAVPITEEESRIHNYGVGPDDSLAHLDLSFKFHSLSDSVDGVLGQTYRPDYVNKLDVSKKMPVMGNSPRFVSSGIFSTDCKAAQFGNGGNPQIAMVTGSGDA
ncbi:hypothetical protein LUZ62_022600 [Rhynchospora pubera]|uniref:Uncharacterized protein n=1 Tax=Rhynchospora pubera TaxID=906938 RepID=A0AAV8GWW3_9POAL|nr:hypothetical protein LUZ62_022600 [Rhynchospora pubera]